MAPSTRQAPSTRPRSTINLKEIAVAPRPIVQEATPTSTANRPLVTEEVIQAWRSYAESQRQNVAEYQLLNREVSLEGTQIVLQVTHPFEEQLLQTLKADATAFLRHQLQNTQITIQGNLMVTEAKKLIYTNREKFEFLLDKHPALKDLRDRFGLDADF